MVNLRTLQRARFLTLLSLLIALTSACGDDSATDNQARGFDVIDDDAADTTSATDAPSWDTVDDTTDATDAGEEVTEDVAADTDDAAEEMDADDTTPDVGPPPGPIAPGLYATRQNFMTLVTLPISPTPSESETVSLILHEVSGSPDALQITHKACLIRQPEQFGVQPVFSDAFFDAIPVSESTLTVSGPDGGPWEVSISPDVQIIGAALSDPATEALPTTANDPRVVDGDLDGNPGVTVGLTGFISGSVYVAQRNIGGMSGTLQADGSMEGLLEGDIEQVVLGATSDLLIDFRPEPTKHPDPALSNFSWRPLAPGTTCDDLVAGEATIFGGM